MLATLRRIVQEVSAAPDLNSALFLVSERVREAIKTDACTIYLVDNQRGEYVMMATKGLNPAAVTHIRLGLTEGMVGLVGKREEPINLEDAPSHPNFYYEPRAGEEKFKAFLGVPIMHKRSLLGVIVAQQEEARRFGEDEEAFLVTLSAQLAGIIAHAKAVGTIEGLYSEEVSAVQSELEFAAVAGMPSVSGIGIGRAVVVYPQADLDAVPDRKAENIEEEIALFRRALVETRDEIKSIKQKLSSTLSKDELALFTVYLRMLGKNDLEDKVIDVISQGQWAQGALKIVVKQHVRQLASMDDEYLRDRANDIMDLGAKVLANLQEIKQKPNFYSENTILVGEQVTAADLADVPEGRLKGIISYRGSSSSHIAILARALNIPTIMGATGEPVSFLEGKEIVLDGYYGHAYVNPSEQLREEFSILVQEEKDLDADLQGLRDLPAQTPDGHEVTLYVNAGLLNESGLSLSVGAAGVGLYRTEVPFLIRERFPSEEEQRVVYRQLLNAFAPRPVIMRTLDVGGDKMLPYFTHEEDNPFLGWRGIRVTLDHPEVFLVQVRAMLRASEGLNNLRIMLPMITTVSEVDESLHLISRAYHEVRSEGALIKMPSVGVMIEVPSAVYQAKAIASRVDFLSIGSNDLTQYILAVDRNNARVSDLYDSLHPAVLGAIRYTIKCAHDENKPVGLCGEMASDPVSIILLMALGLDSLSLNAVSLLRVKWVIRSITYAKALELSREVLALDNAAMIRFRLESALDEAGLGGLIRAGGK